MFGWIKALVPALGSVIGNIFRDSKAEEIKAQIELEEAQAFSRGRYAPRYILKYSLIAIFLIVALLCIVGAFFPNSVNLDHPVDTIERLGRIIFAIGVGDGN